MNTLALAPLPHPVRAGVAIPGSKSYTNRALLMAAMTKGTVVIEQPLLSDDTEAMLRCLRTLGIDIVRHADRIEVCGDISNVQDKTYELDVDLSGITIRFLIALACMLPGQQTIYGGEGLNKRPVGELVDGLRQLGADIRYLGKEGFPPVQVRSSRLVPGTVRMDGRVSSQYFSALLMVAPLLDGDVMVEVAGEQISTPYIDMTIDTMATFGAAVRNKAYKSYHVPGGQSYRALRYAVEGDVSSASYFFAIAALTGSTITCTNLNPASKQADMQFLQILERMGAEVTRNDKGIVVTGHGVQAMDVDMVDCPDQAMTMAVLAAFAPGVTTIRGVQSLRVKETERVVALEQELAKMGIRTSSTPDTLTIHGGSPHAAAIDTYGDHRMAMAFAVAGMALPDMVINNPQVVSKTFPGFWDALAGLRPTNVVLTGMRGSGKSTIAKLIAQRTGKAFVDLDAEIVRHARQDIPTIVDTHGWEHFRNLESAVIAKMANRQNAVIATGGGAILRPANVDTLRQHSTVVWLTAPAEVLAERIQHESGRPALTKNGSLLEELRAVGQEREPLYRQAADITVDTANRTPAQIVDEILARSGGAS